MLPKYDDSFIERGAAMAQLAEMTGRGTRLVTVTGPAGIGKTRLVAEFAHALDWVIFCDLISARTPDELCAVVADALGLPSGGPPETVAQAVAHRLERRPPRLLVLDGFDGLVGYAEWVRAWTVDGCTLVVTSRERLELEGEVVLELGPLEDDGVGLFIARSPDARFDGDGDADVIREIVVALDGIPLAIELAAARTSVMTLAELRERIDARFDLLRDDLAPDSRQASLWRSLAWSWNLLESVEQVVLAQASVFASNFDLAAAEAVLSVPAEHPDAPNLLDALQGLVRKSFVRIEKRDGRTRFGLWASVRAFAEEQRTDDTCVQRHVKFYADFGFARSHPVSQREELAAERHNLYTALDHAKGTDLAKLIVAVEPIATGRSMAWFGVHLRRLDALHTRSVFRARALLVRATALYKLNRMDAALADCTEALQMATDAGDLDIVARAHHSLGDVSAALGDMVRMRSHRDQTREIARRVGNRFIEAVSLAAIAQDLHHHGDPDHEVEQYFRTAIAMFDELDQPLYGAVARITLGGFLIDDQRIEEARPVLEACLTIARAQESAYHTMHALSRLAQCALVEGDLQTAERQYGEVLQFAEISWDMSGMAWATAFLAWIGTERGLIATPALRRADELLQYSPGTASLHMLGAIRALRYAQGDCSRADLEAVIGDFEANAHWWPFAEAMTQIAGIDPADSDDRQRRLDRARVVLPPDSTILRLAIRMLDQALEAAEGSWWIAADGTWFQPPGGTPISVAKRLTLTRILARLSGGEWVDRSVLIAAGWPGETMTEKSARNRLHVAISTLRKLGFSALQREGNGYVVAAPVRVQSSRTD